MINTFKNSKTLLLLIANSYSIRDRSSHPLSLVLQILSRSTLDKCGQATKSGRSFQNAFVTAGERKMEMEI